MREKNYNCSLKSLFKKRLRIRSSGKSLKSSTWSICISTPERSVRDQLSGVAPWRSHSVTSGKWVGSVDENEIGSIDIITSLPSPGFPAYNTKRFMSFSQMGFPELRFTIQIWIEILLQITCRTKEIKKGYVYVYFNIK